MLPRVEGADLCDAVGQRELEGISLDDATSWHSTYRPGGKALASSIQPPLQTPLDFAVFERLFMALRDYYLGSMEAGTWQSTGDCQFCRTTKVSGDAIVLTHKLHSECRLACRLLKNRSFEEAGGVLIAAAADIKSIVLAEHPHTFDTLLELVADIRSIGTYEVASAFLRQFSAMSDIVLGAKHPLKLVCGLLASLEHIDCTSYEHIIGNCLDIICESFEAHLGSLHASAIEARLRFFELSMGSHSPDLREAALRKLLRECEIILGRDSTRTRTVSLHLAYHCLHWQRFREAENAAKAVVVGCRSGSLQVEGLNALAEARYGLGHNFTAEIDLRKAIEVALSIWDPREARTHRLLLLLEERLASQGIPGQAAQVRRQRMCLLYGNVQTIRRTIAFFSDRLRPDIVNYAFERKTPYYPVGVDEPHLAPWKPS